MAASAPLEAEDLAKAEMAIRVPPEDLVSVDPDTGQPVDPDNPRYVTKTLRFYVCTDPRCLDYYGSAGMPDLGTSWNGPKQEDQQEREMKGQSRYDNNRQECPSCRVLGRSVQRKLMSVQVKVPVEMTPSPKPPLERQTPPRVLPASTRI